jgi:hypothetical protein
MPRSLIANPGSIEIGTAALPEIPQADDAYWRGFEARRLRRAHLNAPCAIAPRKSAYKQDQPR